ncbi:unnamed protein product [Rangifer tarandus platyrhynchus]|uniref:Uncharacterized protein n=2 Tax=Rangifer tarandus platyrhynchus TaxID=3082113 RepID=A0ACB0F5F4_RANTA|nr:unnamed protein product [Rangifer tarandus platyrhynchus]CAI9708265.1 unnamed protein product [Rangifer tarandus platyrhynchus]
MRITTSASGIVRGERAGVQLNSCWAILPEVEMQTDLPSRAPDLLKRAFSLFKERHRSRPVKREDYSVHRECSSNKYFGVQNVRITYRLPLLVEKF